MLSFYHPLKTPNVSMDLSMLLCHENNSTLFCFQRIKTVWAASSEFVSSSIPSWQILTAHAQPFRGARDLVFCLKVRLESLPVWASSEGSGETARMRRLAWTFAARIGDKYQIRLTRSSLSKIITVYQAREERGDRIFYCTLFPGIIMIGYIFSPGDQIHCYVTGLGLTLN